MCVDVRAVMCCEMVMVGENIIRCACFEIVDERTGVCVCVRDRVLAL